MLRRYRGPFLKRPQIISNKVLDSLRPYVALSIILLSLLGMWGAARAGVSRLFSNIGKRPGSLELSDRAVRLSISDPEAHFTRGWVLSAKGQSVEAIDELERATALRPRDYYLWMGVGGAGER